MTRINLVAPEDLADQHLFAEWREIKMIPARVRKLWASYSNGIAGAGNFYSLYLYDIPTSYTMSTGHVKFFYNKMLFLYHRYKLLTEELHNRNYNITEHNPQALFFNGIPVIAKLDAWKPRPSEVIINIKRISDRLSERPTWYRYYGEVKPPSFFINQFNHRLLIDTLIDT